MGISRVLTRILAFLQVPSNLSETDLSNEAADSRTSIDTAEEKQRSRLYELAMKLSEKGTSSGEDPESEPRTEPEDPKEGLSSEESTRSVQHELRKVRAWAGTLWTWEYRPSNRQEPWAARGLLYLDGPGQTTTSHPPDCTRLPSLLSH